MRQSSLKKPTLVLVHGWGLNGAIWEPLTEQLSGHFDCISLDIPGYGRLSDQLCTSDLDTLADELLSQAPESAHWCAWSLGGMAVMAAASRQSERFLSINLLCTTPRFVGGPDWTMGVDMATFETFANELKADYQSGIQKFLILQAGAGAHARSLAKEASKLLGQYPPPSPETLSAGLDILSKTDLRGSISNIDIPCQVISGRRDRVVHPNAGLELNKLLPNSNYEILNSGHAPHLSCPEKLCALIIQHTQSSLDQNYKEQGYKQSGSET